MSGTKLAKPSFLAGIEKNLAVLDAYTKDNSKIINSIQELAESIGIDLGGILSGKLDIGSIGNLLTSVSSGKLNINKEQLLGRILDNPTLKSAYRDLENLAKSTGSNILGGLGISPEMANKVFVTVSGITNKVMGADLTTLKGVSTMINSISNGNFAAQFLDKGALSGIISTLAKEGTALGLPDVFTNIAKGIEDKNILMAAAKELLPASMLEGNFKILLDIGQSAINGDLKAVMPGMVEELFKNLKLPIDIKAGDFSRIYDQITSILNDNDSDWMSTHQGSDLTAIKGYYTANNASVNKLIRAKLNETALSIPRPQNPGDPTDIEVQIDNNKFLLLAQAYGRTDVKTVLSKDFPYLKIEVNKGLEKPYIRDPFR